MAAILSVAMPNPASARAASAFRIRTRIRGALRSLPTTGLTRCSMARTRQRVDFRFRVSESPAEREARLYAEANGDAALERMVGLRREVFPCCWEPIEDGHHRVCVNYEEPSADGPIEGQQSLV